MDKDDGFSKSASAENKDPPAQKKAEELIVLDDSSDEDDAGVGEVRKGANRWKMEATHLGPIGHRLDSPAETHSDEDGAKG